MKGEFKEKIYIVSSSPH